MPKGITSTEGLIRKIFKIAHAGDESLFYRGHAKDSYLLEPSLYRKQELIDAEHLLFRELLVSNPADFSSDSSTFEKLVRMQHYSLPTSLDFQCAVKGAVSQWAEMPTRQLSLLPVAVGAVVIRPT